MTISQNQNISIACYLDDNDQLQTTISNNLDSEETSSRFDFDAKELVESFALNLNEEISDAITKQIEKGGGKWLDQFITSKPVLALGITYDFLDKLNEERQINGEEGFKDYAVAVGRTAYNTAIGVTTGAIVTTLVLPASAGVATIIATGLVVGIATDALMDAKFFDDETSSASDKLGNFIREFDLENFKNDAYIVGEFAVDSVKDLLNEAVSGVQEIGQFTQDYFDDLASAEATNLPVRRVDPLTLDLDGDGVELVNVVNSKAFFDLDLRKLSEGEEAEAGQNVYSITNSDGTTTKYVGDGLKEQVGWVKSDDGLLTLDRNGNGTIDNILELFGKNDKTGTEELREYDSNSDGVINSSDTVFNNLKVWQDFDQDGVSDEGELKTLSELGITSINLDDVTSKNWVEEGNLIISEGSYNQTVTDSEGNTSDETKTYANLDLAVNYLQQHFKSESKLKSEMLF